MEKLYREKNIKMGKEEKGGKPKGLVGKEGK